MGFKKPLSLGGVCIQQYHCRPTVRVQIMCSYAFAGLCESHGAVCPNTVGLWTLSQAPTLRLPTSGSASLSGSSSVSSSRSASMSSSAEIGPSSSSGTCACTMRRAMSVFHHSSSMSSGKIAFPSAVWRSGFGRPCLDASSQRFIQSSHSL